MCVAQIELNGDEVELVHGELFVLGVVARETLCDMTTSQLRCANACMQRYYVKASKRVPLDSLHLVNEYSI